MSAASIARWNAIPMARPEVDISARSLKRTRDDMEDDDDDMSIVSRSPSPPVGGDGMQIDDHHHYPRGIEREEITVDTKISSTNKGFAMLAKFGWVEGQPLGLSGDARVEPIPFVLKNDATGIGKMTQDVRMIETTVSQRRELDSERQTKETAEQRKAREDSVAKRIAVQSEISSVLKPFFCELCEKQFQNVAQYDEHTNSYAHHHKARFRDMQAVQRATLNSKEELDKRKEKERKREEKELRKIAKAAGIKITKPAGSAVGDPDSAPSVQPEAPESQPKASGFKKSGWATVGQSSATQSPASSTEITDPPGFAKSGWSAVGGAPAPFTKPPLSSHTTTTSSPTHSNVAPMFRTGGWTSLDTGSIQTPSASAALPPPPPPLPAAAFPPAPGLGMTSSFTRPPQGSDSCAPAGVASGHPSSETSAKATGLLGGASHWKADSELNHSSVPAKPSPAVRQEASRSGWQQFKGSGSSRRR